MVYQNNYILKKVYEVWETKGKLKKCYFYDGLENQKNKLKKIFFLMLENSKQNDFF